MVTRSRDHGLRTHNLAREAREGEQEARLAAVERRLELALRRIGRADAAPWPSQALASWAA